MKPYLIFLFFIVCWLYSDASPFSVTCFSDVYREAAPAVVWIRSGYKNGPSFDLAFPSEELSIKFQSHSQSSLEETEGSGFLVSADGLILTNYHVVKKGEAISVFLNSGKELPAKLLGADLEKDLAVIKVDGTDFPFLTLGDSEKLEVGEWVVAIGNPYGLEASLTAGVVSAKKRKEIGVLAGGELIQTDAVINPGSSGGPLLNLKGEVVGINTALVTRLGGYVGIGFAIPSHLVRLSFAQIIHSTLFPEISFAHRLEQMGIQIENESAGGVLIANVRPDSPAEKSGLKMGYLIVGLATDWNHQKEIGNALELGQALNELWNNKCICLIIKHINYQKYYILKFQ